MASSPRPDPAGRPILPSQELAEELAARLAQAPVLSLVPCTGGGNNRVYRLETAKGRFALKLYPALTDDPRDRLGHEFGALRFLNGRVAPGRLPRALAADRWAGAALYEWMDGTPVTGHGPAEIREVLGLLADLAAAAPLATELGPAVEPCLAASDILQRLAARLEPLDRIAPTERALLVLLAEVRRLTGLLAAPLEARSGSASALPVEALTLSPSDFGFHNALRRADGRLTFLDFEYAGWDDPAKAVSDFLWHAGQELTTEQRRLFAQGVLELYGRDDRFAERLSLVYPLHGLNWVLIVLNEFRPDRWHRRRLAGQQADWAEAKRRQLVKAEKLLERVRLALDLGRDPGPEPLIHRLAWTGNGT